MRNNKILAVAIATALSVGSSSLYAKQDYVTYCKDGNSSLGIYPKDVVQFENVGGNAEWASCIIGVAGETLLDPATAGQKLTRPSAVFDFTGQSVVYNGITTVTAGPGQTTGTVFAAELFGAGSLVLPTPMTSGSSPDYLGVIYTIDGAIPTDFELTFTLDGGATFAENPILGVRDDKGDGIGTLSANVAPGATSANITSSTLGADSVFRFENDATSYLVTGGASGAFNFYRLGDHAGVTVAATTVQPKVYGKVASEAVAGGTTPSYVKSSPVATIAAAGGLATTVSPNTITVTAATDAAKFKAGWTYACNSWGAGHLFTVAAPATGATTLTVSISPQGTKGTTGSALQPWSAGSAFDAGECANNGFIYRIHVPGDTVISLEESSNLSGFAKDQIYTFDAGANLTGCQTAYNNYSTGLTTQYKITTAADSSTKAITIQNMSGGTGLARALCGGEKGYRTDISLSDNWNASGNMNPRPPLTASSAAGKNAATFIMNASATNANLEGGDQLMLLYKLSNVGILADSTQKINMTVDLKTGGAVDTLVNPRRTVTVASSAKALDVSLASLEAGKLNISVSSGNTQFSGEVSPSATSLYGFVNNMTARIGQLSIKPTNPTAPPRMADAVNEFALGDVTAEKSKLIITGGQFQASKATPGKVEIRMYGAGGVAGSSILADDVSIDGEGLWTATWNLDSTDLKNIASSAGDPNAAIEITTDGVAEVNPVENPPVGSLTIDFDNASYQDIVIENADLRKITKDGNVCTVYQVPPPSKGNYGQDVMNIRVTNDSTVGGKLTGKFYNMAGELLWSGDLLPEELKAGATARLSSDDIGKITGATWEGRGVLQISSTIPNMEVMALIRQNGVPFAPLSNLSTAARGTSCSQD